MNKTITMNLSGIIFHIEEDAYEMLNKYLSTIKGYFKDSDGRDEIMSDIEARIAEMLQEKVNNAKQAILKMDVESVIAIMGKPEEFAGDNSEGPKSESTQSENRFTGENKRRRRVFRDQDDKVIGGVCSGIASYFDFDPIWLRAAFAISFFVFGSGLILYIILCIIIPKAKTTAEKLEMRGEKIDVNNIGKVVNEEFEEFKKRMKDFGDEVGSKENKDRIKTSTQKALEFITDVFLNIFKIFGKIIAVFLVFIGIALMIGLLATIFGKGTISVFDSPVNNIHFSIYEFGAAVLPDGLPIPLIIVGLILLIGVPVLSLIYNGVRHLFGIKQRSKIVKYTANTLWFCGVGILIYVGIQIAGDFSEESSSKQTIELAQPNSQVVYLDLKSSSEDDLDMRFYHHRRINFGSWTMISKDENNFKLGYPRMNIVPSENENFQLSIFKSA
ncbi:MAG: PspC domain-containing protein, partial [Bacteroidetes bacterium]|nr:PspC domain-containing protein [Bacteroidota bacterium]